MKYSRREIKDWLSGWFTCDGDGNPVGSLPLETILVLLECKQDGIEAWKKRKEFDSAQK